MSFHEKRQQILKALEKVLRGRRLDEVKVEQIAEAAGVGKGTVYLYFEDKEDIFHQMVQGMLLDEAEDVAVVAASSLDPKEKLIRIGEKMSEHIMRKGQFIRMMHAHAIRRKHGDPLEMMQEHHRRLNRVLIQVFEGAEKSGLLKSGLDLRVVVCAFKGLVLQRSITCMNLGNDIPVEALLNLILEGVGNEE